MTVKEELPKPEIWCPPIEELKLCSKKEILIILTSLSSQTKSLLKKQLEESKGLLPEGTRKFVIGEIEKVITPCADGPTYSFGRNRTHYINSAKIRCAVDIWIPDSTPVATLIFCHGLFEHAMRYTHVIAQFVEKGFLVIAPTLPGFGDSGGKRWAVKKIKNLADEISHVFDLFIESNSALSKVPHFLLGHSMGGSTVMMAGIIDHRLWGNGGGVMLSAPALAVDPSLSTPVKRFFGPIVASILPRIPIAKPFEEGELVSSCHFISGTEDPLMKTKGTPAVTGLALMNVEGFFNENLYKEDLGIPIFMMMGDADKIVDISAADKLKVVKSASVKMWPGLKHEILRETVWRGVANDFLRWSSERVKDAYRTKIALKCKKDYEVDWETGEK
ncbi:alpha/beta hydrolase [Aduncisulcus paluster]|uniref:Alpha/beta hydrolase n=1 Tax=Aduncisulcus paluster TaxID=2918883 RepID=A0ABQ5K7B5_9EUKA|nr:alpha/beta hydrolase [Aduncisulcus paluster]